MQKRSTLGAGGVLICLIKNPYRHLIRRWNWKSACLSAFTRGILVLIANLPAGGVSAIGAMSTEVCYRGLTSGFYSALTQGFRFVKPVWIASLIPTILVPIIADGFEFAVHGIRGTQRLGATIVASLVFTAISTFLELFAMRRGVLVIGQDSGSLQQDLKRIPILLCDFVGEGVRLLSAALALARKGAPVLRRNKESAV
jgi:hypothetical protein